MENSADTFAIFLPIVIISTLFAVTGYLLAKRKGGTPLLFAVIAAIPVLGWAALLYLVGMTDKEVYDRLARIEKSMVVEFEEMEEIGPRLTAPNLSERILTEQTKTRSDTPLPAFVTGLLAGQKLVAGNFPPF